MTYKNIETRFRAWDKKDKRMIVSEQEFIPLKVTNVGVFRLSSLSVTDQWVLLNQDRFEITECLGLLDINGKEVCEGDVCIVSTTKGGYRALVEKCDINPSFLLRRIPERFLADVEYDFIQCNLLKLEIVGNIYQNPELLDEEL